MEGTAGKARMPRAINKALAEINDIAGKRYQTDFESLVISKDRNRAAAQMRQIVGISLKREYSDEILKVGRNGEIRDYQWRINPKKMKAMPETAWQFSLLASSPERRSKETGKAIARRLKRETLLQAYFFRLVHPYLCQDAKTRKEIKRLLRECGLGEFAGLSTPKGLVKAGCANLFAVLVVIMPTLPAAAIAVTALALCVTGLNRICRSSTEPAVADKAPAKKTKRSGTASENAARKSRQ